jgi:hypothetical protein
VDVVKTTASDEISQYPCAPVSVVVEIDQAIIGDNIGAAENDAVITTSAMTVILAIYHKGEKCLSFQEKVPGSIGQVKVLAVVKL